ncbi:hypothetical protein EDD17DRAFT_1507241 [Pisolithus thermaeus]|nr:hypothetical protein EV401DRAFT_1884275 [Pisolithus croceorrhizus]KAI6163535.1 hypothetical protein EDD17DRAFT_1507241 [Pisolithus thermaeus]
MSVVAYPAPCSSQGLKYMALEEEFWKASEGVIEDTSTLAYLIARDSGLGGLESLMTYPQKHGRTRTAPIMKVKSQSTIVISSSKVGMQRLGLIPLAASESATTKQLDKGMGKETVKEEMDIDVDHHQEEQGDMLEGCRSNSIHVTITKGLKNKPPLFDATGSHAVWAASEALAQGTAALLHGWEPEQAIEFNVEDISEFWPLLSQTVKWQGHHVLHYKRHSSDHCHHACTWIIHIIKGTLGEFVHALTDPN